MEEWKRDRGDKFRSERDVVVVAGCAARRVRTTWCGGVASEVGRIRRVGQGSWCDGVRVSCAGECAEVGAEGETVRLRRLDGGERGGVVWQHQPVCDSFRRPTGSPLYRMHRSMASCAMRLGCLHCARTHPHAREGRRDTRSTKKSSRIAIKVKLNTPVDAAASAATEATDADGRVVVVVETAACA